MMRFSEIEAFRAVMLSGSTTAAAQTLHTSQPNVSRAIALLEQNRLETFRAIARATGAHQ